MSTTEQAKSTNDSQVHRSRLEEVKKKFTRDVMGMTGLVLTALILLLVTLGPELSPYNGVSPQYSKVLLAPSVEHPMGTDRLGRDVLTRTWIGGRYALFIAFGSITIAGLLGVTIGSIAGYTTKDKLDQVLMRSMDVIMSFPSIILALALVGVLGSQSIDLWVFEISNIVKIILIIGIVYAPRFARVSRGAIMKEKNKAYVTLARIEGAPWHNIIAKELMPNILSPLIVLVSYRFGSAMIVSAGLGFIGIGVQPPTPSWGVLISEGQQYMTSGEWWLVVAPSLALAITIIGLNLMGDALRDTLDPNITFED